jgi:Enoyl-(Acyl carrier protein) reductase
MPSGSSMIGRSSVNSDMPSPTLAPYAATTAAIANFSASLAQLLGEKGVRLNSVAPGPVWTPLIPSTMPQEKVVNFGDDTPLGRAGQPAELAPVYVLLASDEASYVSGARVAVTGSAHSVAARCGKFTISRRPRAFRWLGRLVGELASVRGSDITRTSGRGPGRAFAITHVPIDGAGQGQHRRGTDQPMSGGESCYGLTHRRDDDVARVDEHGCHISTFGRR